MTPRTIGLISALVVGVVLVALGFSAYNRSASTTAVSNVALASFASTFSKPQNERHMVVQQTAAFPYSSAGWYFLNLNKDCSTFKSSMFTHIVSGFVAYGNTTVSLDQLQVLNFVCGSLTVFFKCLSALSTADADNVCYNIITAAQTKGAPLNRALDVTLPDTYNDDGTSNNGIYALYTLILLPIFCCAGWMVYYRLRLAQADSQYLQDTATFANVAARAPATPYDPTPAPILTAAPAPVMYAAPPQATPYQYAQYPAAPIQYAPQAAYYPAPAQ